MQHVHSDTYIDIQTTGEGADSGDKSSNKAMTGGYKYALRQVFCIETGDDPDKYPSEERVTPKPAPVLKGGMVEKGEELAGSYTAQEFRKDIKLIDQIKAASKKESPAVMKVINAIPDGEKRTIGQIIKELKG
jgi:hypothetical protein